MKKRRLILTNLNKSVFKPRFCQTFLAELVVNSLLNEEVLIREGDLIGNCYITQYLRDDFAFEIFKELLSVGAIKILKLSSGSYPSNVTRNPRLFPMSARAEDQELNRSDAGKQWKATSWEWKLFSRLDEVLTRYPESYRRQNPFPFENTFVAEISELLLCRKEYKLDQRLPFKDISPAMSDKFVEFCHEPDAWKRFLRNRHVKILGTRGDDFYRTQAYQCAELYEPKARRAMQRLIESTYAACECDREKADGRYGRSALVELPARCENYDEVYNEIRKFEVIPIVTKNSCLKLAVAHGIGKVVEEVRGKKAFKHFQDCIKTIGSSYGPRKEYIDPYRTFTDAWAAVCSDYEEAWARHIVHSQVLDKAAAGLFLAVYVTARTLGFLTFGVPYELWGQTFNADIMNSMDQYYVVPRIENWFPSLSQRIRGLVRMPSARAEMIRAATLRCSQVELHAKQKKT